MVSEKLAQRRFFFGPWERLAPSAGDCSPTPPRIESGSALPRHDRACPLIPAGGQTVATSGHTRHLRAGRGGRWGARRGGVPISSLVICHVSRAHTDQPTDSDMAEFPAAIRLWTCLVEMPHRSATWGTVRAGGSACTVASGCWRNGGSDVAPASRVRLFGGVPVICCRRHPPSTTQHGCDYRIFPAFLCQPMPFVPAMFERRLTTLRGSRHHFPLLPQLPHQRDPGSAFGRA